MNGLAEGSEMLANRSDGLGQPDPVNKSYRFRDLSTKNGDWGAEAELAMVLGLGPEIAGPPSLANLLLPPYR